MSGVVNNRKKQTENYDNKKYLFFIVIKLQHLCPVQLLSVIHHLHHRLVTSHVNHPRALCVCCLAQKDAVGGGFRLGRPVGAHTGHGGGSVHRKMLDWSAGPRRTTVDNRLCVYVYIYNI